MPYHHKGQTAPSKNRSVADNSARGGIAKPAPIQPFTETTPLQQKEQHNPQPSWPPVPQKSAPAPVSTTAPVQRVIGMGELIGEKNEKKKPEKIYSQSEGGNLETLLGDLVTATKIQIDQFKFNRLTSLFKDEGMHHFLNFDDLIADVFVEIIGLQPQQQSLSEPEPGQKAVDAKGGQWFISSSTKPEDFDEVPLPEQNQQKFLIQCAVAGGQLYSLILGGPQPDLRYFEHENTPHRASSEVEGYRDWPTWSLQDHIDEVGGTEKEDPLVVKNGQPFIRTGNDPQNEAGDKPVYGLLSAFTAALFLGDKDLNAGNIGLAEDKEDNSFMAVKIDPELSFGNFFRKQKKDAVINNLRNPQDKEDDFTTDFAQTIEQSLGDEDEVADQLKELLTSETARQEIKRTILMILTFSPTDYYGIIDQCISDEFADYKQMIKESLARRIAIFRKALEELGGAEPQQYQPEMTSYRKPPPPGTGNPTVLLKSAS